VESGEERRGREQLLRSCLRISPPKDRERAVNRTTLTERNVHLSDFAVDDNGEREGISKSELGRAVAKRRKESLELAEKFTTATAW